MNNISNLHNQLQDCIVTNEEGKTSIHHASYNFDIIDIDNYTIDEINDLFIRKKEYIDKYRRLEKDLQRFVVTDVNNITSIYHYEFELRDISKYTSDEINELFYKQKIYLDSLIKQFKFKEYILSIPKAYCVNSFLNHTQDPKRKRESLWNIEYKEYWKLLRFLWLTYNDNIYEIRDTWWFLFRSERSSREYFMKEEERVYLNNLPNEFTVYRGYVGSINLRELDSKSLFSRRMSPFETLQGVGYSFSLSKDIGMKYFHEYEKYNSGDRLSMLYEGIISKNEVLAYVNENEENEILLLPSVSNYYGNPY
jgi:hypothetical protein